MAKRGCGDKLRTSSALVHVCLWIRGACGGVRRIVQKYCAKRRAERLLSCDFGAKYSGAQEKENGHTKSTVHCFSIVKVVLPVTQFQARPEAGGAAAHLGAQEIGLWVECWCRPPTGSQERRPGG